MKNYFYIIALCLIIVAGAWKWWACRHLTIRVPADWVFHAEYLGNLVYSDAHGNISKEKNLNLYERSMKVVSWHPARAVVADRYTTYDIQTGDITYESNLEFNINPRTGQVLDHKNQPEAQGLFYLFPQNSQKSNYTTFTYDLNPITMAYDRTVIRDGIQLYVYTYSGAIDFTETYQQSPGESLAAMPKDARIISPDYYREMWIEPITGEFVNIIEDSPGDYLMTADKSKSLGILAVWSGKSTGKSIKKQLDKVKGRLWKLQLYEVWIPVGLLAVALLVIVAAVLLGTKGCGPSPLPGDDQ